MPEAIDSSRRVALLFSGGLDSTVAMASYIGQGFRVLPLTLRYGATHTEAETAAAARICQHYGLQQHIMTLPPLFRYSALIDGRGGNYVPARNVVFLSVGAGFALAHRCGAIAIACNADDHADFPDTRPDFVARYREMLELGTAGACRVDAPFVDTPKSAIVTMGVRLGAPLGMTHTCYQGQPPCRKCQACETRRRAFGDAGIPDPLNDLRAGQP